MRYGYVRTSKNQQYTDRQVNELRKHCDELFIEDGVSARKKRRPVFENLLGQLTSGDELVVLAYDRAFRNVIEGLVALDTLSERGIKFESVQQRFDPTTPDGRLFYTMTLAMAEWEVRNLALRTIDGLKAAVKRGAVLGRPKKRSLDKLKDSQTRSKCA